MLDGVDSGDVGDGGYKEGLEVLDGFTEVAGPVRTPEVKKAVG